jgi:DNA-binding transcriptional ArsR family regulator
MLTFRHLANYNVGMRDFIRITKALADPSRVRVLLALKRGELCVCQISELLQLAPSTISKHLSILHQAGLIESRKDERWVFYRLPGNTAPAAAREAIGWVRKSLAKTAEAREDRRRLDRIVKMNPSTLCQRQTQR